MIADIRQSLIDVLTGTEWMDEETREKALRKVMGGRALRLYTGRIDEVTNDFTCLHSGRPLLFYAGENNTQCL